MVDSCFCFMQYKAKICKCSGDIIVLIPNLSFLLPEGHLFHNPTTTKEIPQVGSREGRVYATLPR